MLYLKLFVSQLRADPLHPSVGTTVHQIAQGGPKGSSPCMMQPVIKELYFHTASNFLLDLMRAAHTSGAKLLTVRQVPNALEKLK